jgi:hypothetical protein
MAESRLVFEAQNIDHFWHWNPLAWHGFLALAKKAGIYAKKS